MSDEMKVNCQARGGSAQEDKVRGVTHRDISLKTSRALFKFNWILREVCGTFGAEDLNTDSLH